MELHNIYNVTCIFDERHRQTIKRCSIGSFRIVCYNLFAEYYSVMESVRENDIPYCPVQALDPNFRRPLIQRELKGYNADIFCLQEVDRSVFDDVLEPMFSEEGLSGEYLEKDGKSEGISIFYSKNKFELMFIEKILLRNFIKQATVSDILKIISSNRVFFENFMSKETCVQIAAFQCKEEPHKYLVVSNNHLFWHAQEHNIRLMQMELSLRAVRDVIKKCKEMTKGNQDSRVACIIAGDFNSTPYSGVVDLLTKGYVAANHIDWYSKGTKEKISDTELHNPIKMKSACGFPDYTNLVAAFHACLDYIFIDTNELTVERVIPQPKHSEVTRHTALPSMSAPSDHIAQVVDLKWR